MQIACRSEEPGKKGHHEDLGHWNQSSGLPSFPAKKKKEEKKKNVAGKRSNFDSVTPDGKGVVMRI